MADSKDFWDKLGALSTLISSVVIGAVGLWVTNEYNNKQLAISQIQQQQQSDIDRTRQLEELFPFLSSDDPGKRRFGYAMFVALGREGLALSLMSANNDTAGQPIAASLTANANNHVATQARAVESTLSALKLSAWLAPAPAQTSVSPPTSSPSPTPSFNPDRANALQEWLNNRGLNNVRLQEVLTNPKFDATRQKAIAELGVKAQ